MTRPQLYHFTCDHGAAAIAAAGEIRPMTPWPAAVGGIGTGLDGAPPVCWFTDNPRPTRESVGLTSRMLSCDRMAHRIPVGRFPMWPWEAFAIMYEATDLYCSVLASYGDPSRWWVSTKPVPLTADEVPA